MKTIKWGIIGAGTISRTFATALNSMEHTELIAIGSRDIGRAEEFAKQFNVRKAYGSYEELVKDNEIDVVYIGTPHTEHMDNAAMAIKQGKAVLCEKPFTVNVKDSKALIQLAREYKVFLMEAMWTKFLPVTIKVKNWIKEGRIGEIKHIKADFGYQSEYNPKGRLYNPELAGGALLDVGIYPITYVVHLLEKLPDQVISSAVIGKTGVDEQNAIIMKYNSGVLADLTSSVTLEIGKDAEIIGDKGRIVIPRFWCAEEALLYGKENELLDSYEMPFAPNGYVYEAKEVNACLREGLLESSRLPLSDTLEIMRLMDDIRAEWGLVYPQETN